MSAIAQFLRRTPAAAFIGDIAKWMRDPRTMRRLMADVRATRTEAAFMRTVPATHRRRAPASGVVDDGLAVPGQNRVHARLGAAPARLVGAGSDVAPLHDGPAHLRRLRHHRSGLVRTVGLGPEDLSQMSRRSRAARRGTARFQLGEGVDLRRCLDRAATSRVGRPQDLQRGAGPARARPARGTCSSSCRSRVPLCMPPTVISRRSGPTSFSPTSRTRRSARSSTWRLRTVFRSCSSSSRRGTTRWCSSGSIG